MRKDKRIIALLVLPGFLVFMVAVFVPILLSIYFGTTDWDGISKPIFIGLENFKTILFEDKLFWKSLFNSLFLSFCLIVLQHPICMMVALFIDKVGGRAEKVFRAIFFLPAIISIMVTSKMWVNILDPNHGLLNKVLHSIGAGQYASSWLSDTRFSLLSIALIVMWQGFGWGMLIYYTGIKNLPEDVFEAARIDGANKFQQFFKVTLPLLKPVIKVNFTLAIISGLKQMETVYLTTNGGPMDSSQVIANYLYKQAFSAFQYGYSNAISVLFVIACLVATVTLQVVFKDEEVN